MCSGVMTRSWARNCGIGGPGGQRDCTTWEGTSCRGRGSNTCMRITALVPLDAGGLYFDTAMLLNEILRMLSKFCLQLHASGELIKKKPLCMRHRHTPSERSSFVANKRRTYFYFVFL